ncbi:MAG: PadR family transcriptional regulator [Nocardioidaceae bacterium]
MKADVLRGQIDALILASVEEEPLHGYAIAERIASRSGGALEMATGTLYPALRRLEKAKWLRSEWSTVGGRKRRTYQLTAAGERALSSERDSWRRMSEVVEAVLRPAKRPT